MSWKFSWAFLMPMRYQVSSASAKTLPLVSTAKQVPAVSRSCWRLASLSIDSSTAVPVSDASELVASSVSSVSSRSSSTSPVEVSQSEGSLLEASSARSGSAHAVPPPVEQSVHVCDDHDSGTDLCQRCDCYHAVQVHARCTNCIHEELTPFVLGRLIATTDFLTFLAAHGLNPVLPSPDSLFYDALFDYDEEIVSLDPFEGRFTNAIEEDSLTFTVDDDLTVVDVSGSDVTGTG